MAEKLPFWFFIASGSHEKQRAIQFAQIYDEAKDLKNQYSDQLAAQAKDRYPVLYQYMMGGAKESTSFILTLGQRYGQSAVTLNLAALMNELNDRYSYHLVWANDPQRYQAIIDGLRAEQMEASIDFEKSTRYAMNFQNRIIKGYSALAALDQHEAVIKQGLPEPSEVLIAPKASEEIMIPPDVEQ